MGNRIALRNGAVLNEGQYIHLARGVFNEFTMSREALVNQLADIRKNIDKECDHPTTITMEKYRTTYERNEVAQRVVHLYPDEVWQVDPEVYVTLSDKLTSSEKVLEDLIEEHQLWHYCWRLDRLAGVGHFGGLLCGVSDGLSLDKPVAGVDPITGERDPKKKFNHKLLYLRPFDQSLMSIKEFELNTASPRYGWPKMYNVKFMDLRQEDTGIYANTSAKETAVHWTRIFHYADNLGSSNVIGVPRMRPVFNRLIAINKILSGDGEGFWAAAIPGLAIQSQPHIENPEIDEDKVKKAMYDFHNKIQKYLLLMGTEAKTIAPTISDPTPHFEAQLAAVAMCMAVPLRVLMGSEEAKLASTQDIKTWRGRVKKEQTSNRSPILIHPLLKRFQAYGVIPEDKYRSRWPDINALSDEEKANNAVKKTLALANYVDKEVSSVIPEKEYLTKIIGMESELADLILEARDAAKPLQTPKTALAKEELQIKRIAAKKPAAPSAKKKTPTKKK